MLRKTMIISLLFAICSFEVKAWGADPNSYISEGKALMFQGTFSGLRQAYDVFDQGIYDSSCAQCSNNSELIFLHALTRSIMWGLKDDGQPIDSALELARHFNVELLSDYWSQPALSYPNDFEKNQHDYYNIPQLKPEELAWLAGFNIGMINEIAATIAELDSITETPVDRFRIFFCARETGLLTDLEVDYAEVLMLKGALTLFKGMLEQQQAYDLIIDAENLLLQKNYGHCFNMNNDLLLSYPNFLKIFPTAGGANDGKAILAKVRQDWIAGMNYYLAVVDYIRSEEDLQEDDLLYLDPADNSLIDGLNEKLLNVRDSLINDTRIEIPAKTEKMYELIDEQSSLIGRLILEYDISGTEGDRGWLELFGNDTSEFFSIDSFVIEDNYLEAEFEYYSVFPNYQWRQGYFYGTLGSDSNNITDGTFEYWGYHYDENWNYYYDSLSINKLSGRFIDSQITDEICFDLNPLLGSSGRYPEPVNPRYLLPLFDQWNNPVAGTIGHGLSDDATLGGMVPFADQTYWQNKIEMQSGQQIIINSGTAILDGSINEWSSSHLILQDEQYDTINGFTGVAGVDIDKLYLSYDQENLYGAITFYDSLDANTENYHTLALNYWPKEEWTEDSLIFRLYVTNCQIYGDLYRIGFDEDGYPTMNYITTVDGAAGSDAIEFEIPLNHIPNGLTGRFIEIDSGGRNILTDEWNEETNMTQLKIAGLGSDQLGSITGTVGFAGYTGNPIYVQAYCDPADPENSLLASTMIQQPGQYVLEGLGLGWHGYVRAFTPLYGFSNPFELEAFDIQKVRTVSMAGANLSGIDIELNLPVVLEKNVWQAGYIDAQTKGMDWYCFDAIAGGTYILELSSDSADYACMTLFGRDGYTELEERFYLQEQRIGWTCPVAGRYYVKVTDGFDQSQGGTYQIRMSCNVQYLAGDLASADGSGIKDGTVDGYDLGVLASNWMCECLAPYWCNNADMDKSGRIDYEDFALLASQWLVSGSVE